MGLIPLLLSQSELLNWLGELHLPVWIFPKLSRFYLKDHINIGEGIQPAH
jgi:hypothetical protein